MNIERKKANLILGMVLSITFLVTSIALAGGLKAVKKYPIPEHGTLELNVLLPGEAIFISLKRIYHQQLFSVRQKGMISKC